MKISPLPSQPAAPRAEASLRPVAWGGVLLLAAVLAILAGAVWTSYWQAVEESRVRAGFIARTLERSVTRTLEAVELAMVNVGEALPMSLSLAAPSLPVREPDAGGVDGQEVADPLAPVRGRIADTLRFAPHVRQIAVIEGDRVIAASRRTGEGERVDLARADLASRLGAEADAGAGLSLGLRLGARVEGRFLPLLGGPPEAAGRRSILAVAVPAPTMAGETPRAVLAALNPDYFVALFTDAGVGANGAVRLLRYDGRDLVGLGAAVAALPQGLGTTIGEEVQIGDGDRLTTFRLSSRYPVVVAVSLARADVFAHWFEANRLVLLVLVAVTLAVLASVVLLARETARRVGLQRQVRLLFSAVEQASAVVIITDAERRIEYVNPEFTRLFGYSPWDARGRNPSMLGSGLTSGETYANLWATLAAGKPWRGEFVNRTRDGAVRVMASTISAVTGGDGRVSHYISVMEDISDRKALEAERERMIAALSRSNTEMARLTEVMSHHFQEPVRRLATFASRLRQVSADVVKDPDARISLDFIDTESRRLRSLVSDVQVYLAAHVVRPGAVPADGEAVRALVAEEVAAVVPRLEAADGRIDVGVLPGVPLDAARLRQLVHQLLKNAADHAGRPGQPPVIRIGGEVAGKVVRLRVEDNGPGVPPAYRERVFRLFEKLKASGPGTGIGLAIARRIIESRGGRIWIEDGSEGGCAVVFELPLDSPPGHRP